MNLRLKKLREEKHIRQIDISKFLNCAQETYSRYELGISQPSLEIIAKLAKFYNTSVDYIMFLTDNPKPYK